MWNTQSSGGWNQNLEADMEGSDQASKVNYSKDDYRFVHEAALHLSIRTRWGVKIDIIGEQA